MGQRQQLIFLFNSNYKIQIMCTIKIFCMKFYMNKNALSADLENDRFKDHRVQNTRAGYNHRVLLMQTADIRNRSPRVWIMLSQNLLSRSVSILLLLF